MHVKPNMGTIRKARVLLLYRHRENSAPTCMSTHCCYELLRFTQQRKQNGLKVFFVFLLYFLAVIQSVLTEAVRNVHVSHPCVHRLIPLIRVCCLLKRCRGRGTGARTKEIREHRQTTNFSLLFHTRLS